MPRVVALLLGGNTCDREASRFLPGRALQAARPRL